MVGTGKLVVISGPSGVGKSTVTKQVVARTNAQFSVSATTRKPRAGEVDGKDYYFLDRPAFEKMIKDGGLLEWAEVFGQLYGTPLEPVKQAISQGKTIILDIDVQGGLQVNKIMPEATFILIVPPSMAELSRRLAGRASEDEKSLNARLAKADEEIRIATQSGAYNNVVINDDLENAIRQIIDIVK